MNNFFKEPIVRFLSVGFLLYIGWMALYEWVIHPWGILDDWVASNTLVISKKILNAFGYEVEREGLRVIKIVGSPGVFLGDNCDGIALFALFSIFIIAFPGKIRAKLFYIPIGILIIHFLNTLRVVILAIIILYSYEWTEFNHTYTFTIIIYGCIFLMWLYWINKYSGLIKK